MGLTKTPRPIVDHRKHNKFDNRKSQLRIANDFQNTRNHAKLKNNTSGCTGVTRHKDGGWVARIGFNNKRLYLGYFQSYDEAVKARQEAEEKYHADFSYSNSMKGDMDDNMSVG